MSARPSADAATRPPTARVRLDTRLPAADGRPGAGRTLTAIDPVRRLAAPDLAALMPELAAIIGDLAAIGPSGLLVGLLPYPCAAGQPALPAECLLFDRHADTPTAPPAAAGDFRLLAPFSPDWPRAGYEEGVRRVLDYLLAGDAYQVNLAQRFSARCAGDSLALYEHLRARYAPPYAAWLDTGSHQVISLSPESFLEVDGDRVVTRPIKGTRPRHPDPATDARVLAELAAAGKDRAENLMIVDLLRNDLGRVCATGSVQVPALFEVESYRNVHHLVSTVSGRLAPGAGIPALLAACFPGGSITGAPKRRAMEIIAELEPQPRLAYCGSLFWLKADGRFGSNILIRTFLARDGHLHCWGGAGIVADSLPAAEYRECLDKVGPLMQEAEKAFLRD